MTSQFVIEVDSPRKDQMVHFPERKQPNVSQIGPVALATEQEDAEAVPADEDDVGLEHDQEAGELRLDARELDDENVAADRSAAVGQSEVGSPKRRLRRLGQQQSEIAPGKLLHRVQQEVRRQPHRQPGAARIEARSERGKAQPATSMQLDRLARTFKERQKRSSMDDL